MENDSQHKVVKRIDGPSSQGFASTRGDSGARVGRYTIRVRGEIPMDLAQQVSSLHALAILHSDGQANDGGKGVQRN